MSTERTQRPHSASPDHDALCLRADERRELQMLPDDRPRQLPPSREEASRTGTFGELRGRSAQMLDLYEQIRRVAPTDATVLLAGETGTGKEVVARTIHDLSERCGGAFVALNCGAVSATLIESELFGHEQGSFTGASRRHNGVFARASGGTLFLDEITEMPLDLQVKLLRVLETGLFHRVGGERAVQTQVRIIAAANRVLAHAVREGRLREDLFYRLGVFPISLPPLRRRADDISLLADHFLGLLNRENGTDKRFAAKAIERLTAHDWPGNVRELKNFVHRAFILADGDLDAEALQPSDLARAEIGRIEIKVGCSIAAAERHLIAATMECFAGRKVDVAKALGISLKTLYSRLNEYEASSRAVG